MWTSRVLLKVNFGVFKHSYVLQIRFSTHCFVQVGAYSKHGSKRMASWIPASGSEALSASCRQRVSRSMQPLRVPGRPPLPDRHSALQQFRIRKDDRSHTTGCSMLAHNRRRIQRCMHGFAVTNVETKHVHLPWALTLCKQLYSLQSACAYSSDRQLARLQFGVACCAWLCQYCEAADARMASQQNNPTLTSGNSFTERSRPRRNDSFSETPVKTRPEGSNRLLATPLSARQHRPASRGLTSHSSRVPVETPLVRVARFLRCKDYTQLVHKSSLHSSVVAAGNQVH